MAGATELDDAAPRVISLIASSTEIVCALVESLQARMTAIAARADALPTRPSVACLSGSTR